MAALHLISLDAQMLNHALHLTDALLVGHEKTVPCSPHGQTGHDVRAVACANVRTSRPGISGHGVQGLQRYSVNGVQVGSARTACKIPWLRSHEPPNLDSNVHIESGAVKPIPWEEARKVIFESRDDDESALAPQYLESLLRNYRRSDLPEYYCKERMRPIFPRRGASTTLRRSSVQLATTRACCASRGSLTRTKSDFGVAGLTDALPGLR